MCEQRKKFKAFAISRELFTPALQHFFVFSCQSLAHLLLSSFEIHFHLCCIQHDKSDSDLSFITNEILLMQFRAFSEWKVHQTVVLLCHFVCENQNNFIFSTSLDEHKTVVCRIDLWNYFGGLLRMLFYGITVALESSKSDKMLFPRFCTAVAINSGKSLMLLIKVCPVCNRKLLSCKLKTQAENFVC